MRLSGTARDSEFAYSYLEGRSIHSQKCCCSIRTCHNPIALLESLKNLLTFRFLQSAVECTICRFQRSGLFRNQTGLGKFQIANVHS